MKKFIAFLTVFAVIAVAVPTFAAMKEVKCTECHGSRKCTHCHGKGKIPSYNLNNPKDKGKYSTCYVCHGNGKCNRCHGRGKKRIQVRQ